MCIINFAAVVYCCSVMTQPGLNPPNERGLLLMLPCVLYFSSEGFPRLKKKKENHTISTLCEELGEAYHVCVAHWTPAVPSSVIPLIELSYFIASTQDIKVLRSFLIFLQRIKRIVPNAGEERGSYRNI